MTRSFLKSLVCYRFDIRERDQYQIRMCFINDFIVIIYLLRISVDFLFCFSVMKRSIGGEREKENSN